MQIVGQDTMVVIVIPNRGKAAPSPFPVDFDCKKGTKRFTSSYCFAFGVHIMQLLHVCHKFPKTLALMLPAVSKLLMMYFWFTCALFSSN